MPNMATVLRDEIARLARKELRNYAEGLKKASTQHRRDIAQLKRQVLKLERQVSQLDRQTPKKASVAQASPDAVPSRFTAKGLRSQRQRLGLSAADYAKLAGVTSRSIYNWEQEIARPRLEQTAILATLRGIGKKEALARLSKLAKQQSGKKKKS
jgi:DNA-binding transcriptional regulator YiaG